MSNEKLMLRALAKYWEIVEYIADHEDYMGKIAETVKVDLSRVSKAVKELENYGVVSVRGERPEGRGGFKKYVSLTERGRVIVEAVKYGVKAQPEEVLTKEQFEILKEHAEKHLRKAISYILGECAPIGIISVAGAKPKYVTSSEGMMYVDDLVSHLEEYPNLYSLYREVKELREKIDQAKDSIRKAIGSKIPKGIDESLLNNIVDVVMENLYSLAKEGETHINHIRVKEGEVVYGGYTLSKSAEDLEAIKKFLDEEVKEHLEEAKEIVEAETEYHNKYEELSKGLRELQKQFEIGNIRGRCKTCRGIPRIIASTTNP
jgi:DNA-binding MarR family transcriptional regulator